MNKKLYLILIAIYLSIAPNLFAQHAKPVCHSKKWGFIDTIGNVIGAIRYDDVDRYFSEGYAAVKLGKKWSVIDSTGKEIIPFTYNNIWHFKEGLAKVTLNDYFGFINTIGKEVIACKYDDAYDFSMGLAAVKKDGKWGFIDKQGQIAAPLIYEKVYSFKNGLALVMKNKKFGYIDRSGKEIIPCQYDKLEEMRGGYAFFLNDGKSGQISKFGIVAIPEKYDRFEFFEDGFAPVMKNKKWGFVDTLGHELAPCKYDTFYYGYYGHLWVCINKKWGLLNMQGKEVTPVIYDDNGYFFFQLTSHNLAVVKQNGLYGLISESGKIIFPCSSSEPPDYYQGLISINKNGKKGFIDTLGNEVVPFIYDQITKDNSDSLYLVSKEKKYGYLNISGKELIPCEFDSLFNWVCFGLFKVFQNGKQGLYKPDSGMLYNCQYSGIEQLDLSESGSSYFLLSHDSLKCIGDQAGKIITPCRISEIMDLNDTLSFVKLSGVWNEFNKKIGTFIDLQATRIEPLEFYLSYYEEYKDYIIYNDHHEAGFITPEGKFTGYLFDTAIYKESSNLCIKKNNKCGIADLLTGQIIIPCKYDSIGSIYTDDYGNKTFDFFIKGQEYSMDNSGKKYLLEYVEPVKINKKWGLRNGEFDSVVLVVEPIYDKIESFGEGYNIFLAKKNGKTGIITSAGDTLIPFEYKKIYLGEKDEIPFLIVEKDGKKGAFALYSHKFIIPCKYQDIVIHPVDWPVGFFDVKNKKWGLTGLDGTEIIPCRFDRFDFYFTSNEDGVNESYDFIAIYTYLGKKCGLYEWSEKHGTRQILPAEYQSIDTEFYLYIRVEKNGKWGVADLDGKIVVPIKYDEIFDINEDKAYFRLKDRTGSMDFSGNEVFDDE